MGVAVDSSRVKCLGISKRPRRTGMANYLLMGWVSRALGTRTNNPVMLRLPRIKFDDQLLIDNRLNIITRWHSLNLRANCLTIQIDPPRHGANLSRFQRLIDEL